ncbi:hypothetical protein FALBO_10610 [Fusarium albosuccineum]|uniref:Ankyrin repeat protein n=1 Tax=Fusarium albosuccineum TaxID=1237068 RepID=A0A8H4L5P7_9HYPO|nr:hypothetical protein FALBO_10610 [Fusarium albosuccineum]
MYILTEIWLDTSLTNTGDMIRWHVLRIKKIYVSSRIVIGSPLTIQYLMENAELDPEPKTDDLALSSTPPTLLAVVIARCPKRAAKIFVESRLKQKRLAEFNFPQKHGAMPFMQSISLRKGDIANIILDVHEKDGVDIGLDRDEAIKQAKRKGGMAGLIARLETKTGKSDPLSLEAAFQLLCDETSQQSQITECFRSLEQNLDSPVNRLADFSFKCDLQHKVGSDDFTGRDVYQWAFMASCKAVKGPLVETAMFLAEQPDIDLRYAMPCGCSAVKLALKRGNVGVLKVIFGRLRESNHDISSIETLAAATQEDLSNALTSALSSGDGKLSELLIDNGAKPSSRDGNESDPFNHDKPLKVAQKIRLKPTGLGTLTAQPFLLDGCPGYDQQALSWFLTGGGNLEDDGRSMLLQRAVTNRDDKTACSLISL